MKFLKTVIVFVLSTVMILFSISSCDQKTAKPEEMETTDSKSSLTVYKKPSCGCCEKWVSHMRKAGFNVKVEEYQYLNSIKKQYNINAHQQSCHTVVSNDKHYVFEGHIPADIIQRFLDEQPQEAAGLIVPGMPMGSPGMEHGDLHTPYDVLILMNDGTTTVYQHVDS